MTQKFIDRDGLKVLWNQVNLKDYPNNETLMAVIDAIDETKADKDELFSKSWNDLTDRPFYENEDGTVVTLDEKYIPDTIARTSNIPQPETSVYDTLITTNKTIVGAINEVNDKLPTPDITDRNKVLTVNSDGTAIWDYPLIIDATKTKGYQYVNKNNRVAQELLVIDIINPILGRYRMKGSSEICFPFVRIMNGDTLLVSAKSLSGVVDYIDVKRVDSKFVEIDVTFGTGGVVHYTYDVINNSWEESDKIYSAHSVNYKLSQKLDIPTNTGTTGQIPVYQEDGTTIWSDLPQPETSVYDTLITTNKTIVGAINELDAEMDSHNHDDMYYTEAEVDAKIEAIPNYVVRNLEDVTKIAEKSTMVGFYFYLNNPLPNGLYYYDKLKRPGKMLTCVIVNAEGTAVDKQFTMFIPYLLYISSDEECVYIYACYDTGGSTKYIYDIANKTYTIEEKTYNAKKIDYIISDLNASITEQLTLKAELDHNHDDIYYTETEIDQKLSTINTSIANITSGSTPVKEAEHSSTADTATNATNANHATSADSATSATKATQDGNGKVISSTYETKIDATAKLTEAKEYVNTSIANLVNSAPETMDTLGELATAMAENDDVIEALDAAITQKANLSDVEALNAAMTQVDNKTSTITSKVDIIDDKIEKIIDDKNFDELKMLVEANIVNILSDNNNTILTDNNGKIYVL